MGLNRFLIIWSILELEIYSPDTSSLTRWLNCRCTVYWLPSRDPMAGVLSWPNWKGTTVRTPQLGLRWDSSFWELSWLVGWNLVWPPLRLAFFFLQKKYPRKTANEWFERSWDLQKTTKTPVWLAKKKIDMTGQKRQKVSRVFSGCFFWWICILGTLGRTPWEPGGFFVCWKHTLVFRWGECVVRLCVV